MGNVLLIMLKNIALLSLVFAKDTKNRCITKFQKKIDKNIISGEASIGESNGYLKLTHNNFSNLVLLFMKFFLNTM